MKKILPTEECRRAMSVMYVGSVFEGIDFLTPLTEHYSGSCKIDEFRLVDLHSLACRFYRIKVRGRSGFRFSYVSPYIFVSFGSSVKLFKNRYFEFAPRLSVYKEKARFQNSIHTRLYYTSLGYTVYLSAFVVT